jgi:hypothetical protein
MPRSKESNGVPSRRSKCAEVEEFQCKAMKILNDRANTNLVAAQILIGMAEIWVRLFRQLIGLFSVRQANFEFLACDDAGVGRFRLSHSRS